MEIHQVTDDAAINIALDTVSKGKQAIVFCSTRRSAESVAERIGKKLDKKYPKLSRQILKALSSPTKQCKRLAYCVKKQTAFHHAGLHAKQRKIVEESFKRGNLKVVCATPTLAMGINLPAFRTIMRNLKRYGGRWGMQYIPTLEYHQMAGRAGRPDFNDDFGEAIAVAKTEKDKEEIRDRYILADPEDIHSKLAVEPVLRTYCLSLLATGFAKSDRELIAFFEETFYGSQYGDMEKLASIIGRILQMLEEWEFIDTRKEDFVPANELGSSTIKVTRLGHRVSQLYIDPYTAHQILTALRRATQMMPNEMSFLHLATSSLELRPLSNVRMSEIDRVEAGLNEISDDLIVFEPSVFEPEYDEFLKSIKTALALEDWMNEKDENHLMQYYNITPGELHTKKNLVDWILYATEELAQLLSYRDLVTLTRKTRYRLDKGVKEELIPLVRLKNIGRIRARKLYRNGIKDIGGVKDTDITKLKQLLGEKTALNLKKQVGQDIKEVPKGTRKGQTSIRKY